jgi:uncharacterized protein YkwD
MLGLFLLQKNDIVENKKLFFQSIGKENKVSTGDIYKQINSQDFIGALSTSSVKKATTVKAFVQDDMVDEKPTARISVDGIIYYTNIERVKVGLNPLTKNTKLNNSATSKIDDMFMGQYFEHTAPNGKTAADLVKSFDYKFQIVGENLALGIFQTDKSLVQAWMDSPTHRANILNPKYTEIGAAVGIGDYKSQKQWLAVQHFAKPMPLCDEIDENVQNNINKEKTVLEAEERELQKRAGVIESDQSIAKQYISEYNAMVVNYNDRLNKLRITINNFNETIVKYNSCIKGQ